MHGRLENYRIIKKNLNKKPCLAISNVTSNTFFRSYSNIKIYDKYEDKTSETLNKLVTNQGISI